MDLHFDLPKEQSSIIKVIGVGGGGSNAVNHMFNQGIVGVNFVVCNTDAQALEMSPIPNKIQLGPEITQGLGAGSRPEIGRDATLESEAQIRDILSKNTKMAFITAGMGGGTGTGGAPVIAKIAREMDILTVGIVTTPFSFEGRRKLLQAEEGINELRKNVDTILIISNDKIREIFGNLSHSQAFGNADGILMTAAKSISEIITIPGIINVDFADVQYVMEDSGVAIMGSYTASGEDRALRSVQGALSSPLLNDSDIRGAKNILINITSGIDQVSIDEITEINDFVQQNAGNDADVIMGVCNDETLADKISVTIIATGFNGRGNGHGKETVNRQDDKVVLKLDQDIDPPSAEEEMSLVDRSEPTPQQPPRQEEPQLFSEDKTEEEDADLNFQIRTNEPPRNEPVDQPSELSFYTSSNKSTPEPKENRRSELEDRKKTLKELSYRFNKPNSLSELENEPAYKRRSMELKDVPHSSEEEISRYSLGEGDGQRPEIRKNNSFLHDNVD